MMKFKRFKSAEEKTVVDVLAGQNWCMGLHQVTLHHTETPLWVVCNGWVTVCREFRRRRAELGNNRNSLIYRTNGIQNNKITRQIHKHFTTNNFTHRHGGNWGLNTWQVMREYKPGVWENKTKQMENERWIEDRWLEDRWRQPPNAARTGRGTDFGGSHDSVTVT
jgi:hypothetical protein